MELSSMFSSSTVGKHRAIDTLSRTKASLSMPRRSMDRAVAESTRKLDSYPAKNTTFSSHLS